MTTCPKCAHVSPDDEQCARCGIIFERMFTVLDHSPVGASEAGRRASQVARTLGASPLDRSEAPTVELPSVTLAGLSPPAPAAPPVVPLVARAPPPRRVWLLAALLAALALLFVDQLNDRREVQQRREEAAAVAGRAVVDAAYLSLAVESMLDKARSELRRVDDPVRSAETMERLLARVSDLEQRLDAAVVEPVDRAHYADVLSRLRAFLQQDVKAAISLAQEGDARAQSVSVRALEQAEASFQLVTTR